MCSQNIARYVCAPKKCTHKFQNAQWHTSAFAYMRSELQNNAKGVSGACTGWHQACIWHGQGACVAMKRVDKISGRIHTHTRAHIDICKAHARSLTNSLTLHLVHFPRHWSHAQISKCTNYGAIHGSMFGPARLGAVEGG